VEATLARALQSYDLLRPIGALTSDLTAGVNAMSARIHLIGLNAQVQAALANEGKIISGLEVLSARTSEISKETSRISELAAHQLDELASGLAQTVKTFAALRADGLAQNAVLNDEGKTQEQQLHAVRDTALQTLMEIGKSLDSIKSQSGRIISSIDFAEFYGVTIPALQAPLVAIAEKAELWLESQGHAVDQANLIDSLRKNYTMATEHEVFHAIVAQSAPPADAAEVQGPAKLLASVAENLEPVAAGAGGDSFGINVELF